MGGATTTRRRWSRSSTHYAFRSASWLGSTTSSRRSGTRVITRVQATGRLPWCSPANAWRCRPMQRIEAIRHSAQVVTKDDLLTTSTGQTWDDWWNYKPADNTFFTGILGSVTTTALGLAV